MFAPMDLDRQARRSGARGRVAERSRARRDWLRDPADRRGDPGHEGEGRGHLQPDGRRLRPGAVPGAGGAARRACAPRWRPGTRTTRRRTACSALREAVARFYERDLGLTYPVESVLITGGARPLLYGSYRTVLDPGDAAVYPVPSWNNNHYAYLCGARAIEIPVRRGRELLPDARRPAPAHRRGAPRADQLAAQPDRDGDRPGRAAEDLRADRRGEPPPRARGRQGRCGSATTRSTGSC